MKFAFDFPVIRPIKRASMRISTPWIFIIWKQSLYLMSRFCVDFWPNQTVFSKTFNRNRMRRKRISWKCPIRIAAYCVAVWKSCRKRWTLMPCTRTTQRYSIRLNVFGICVRYFWSIRRHRIIRCRIWLNGFDSIFPRLNRRRHRCCLQIVAMNRTKSTCWWWNRWLHKAIWKLLAPFCNCTNGTISMHAYKWRRKYCDSYRFSMSAVAYRFRIGDHNGSTGWVTPRQRYKWDASNRSQSSKKSSNWSPAMRLPGTKWPANRPVGTNISPATCFTHTRIARTTSLTHSPKSGWINGHSNDTVRSTMMTTIWSIWIASYSK